MTVRMDARGLTAAERFKFARHRLYAAAGYQRRAPLRLREVDGHCRISAPDGELFTVSPRRWRRYKRGLVDRLRELDQQYMFSALDPPLGPVLDIGAHVGEFALLASNRGRTVYSVEADPDALSCLMRNLEGRSSVTVIDALVWSTEKDIAFNLATADANSSVFAAAGITGTVRRRATTLDRIAEEHGIDGLAFLKCDAEGAEPEVLEGGRELLLRTARIAIDTGPERQGGRTSDACETLLRDAGFAVRTREHGRIVTYGTRDPGRLPG